MRPTSGCPSRRRRSSGRALLERLGIADKADAKVDALSGGQQQRLMIARALIHEPTVIFLDEPTVGLDPQARLDLWEILRDLHAQGRTIIMTTHYMEEADQLCDRIAIVDRGRLLACDTPEALKARAPGGTLIEVTLDGAADGAADGGPGGGRRHARRGARARCCRRTARVAARRSPISSPWRARTDAPSRTSTSPARASNRCSSP